MNATLLASDILARVAEMDRDCLLNNEALVARIITEEYRRTHTMFVVCAWCQKSLGTKPCLPEMAGQTSHGMCDACFQQKLSDLQSR